MGYTPSFTPQYENGWEDLPSETSPITAEALNAYDDAIENIEDYLASDESQGNLADAYDETATYEAGDYVIYGGDLYKCLEDIDTPEEWDSTKWESCLITDEMATSGGTNVIANPSGEATETLTKLQVENTIYGISGGGGNANIWTGTQAELEEVFDELEEGTQINITDDEQEVVEGGTIYSEDEQCIGLWIDNKPLYQRTFVNSFSDKAKASRSYIAITEDMSSSDYSIIDINGYIQFTSGNRFPISLYATEFIQGSTDQNSAYVSYVVNATGVTTLLRQNFIDGTASGEIVTTLKYTKASDAPLDVVVGKKTMYIASSDCYSTEEKEIGCWTDGKPLYQKSFIFTSGWTLGNWSIIADLSSLNIENFISAQGRLSRGNLNLQLPFEGSIYPESSNNYKVSFRYYAGNLETLVMVYNDIDSLAVTIRYTKTSDTAGSGQYTPASGKAVHYSTDEQVIGTWIDGKPIYRKSFTYASASLSSGQLSLANDLSNVARVINKHCQIHAGADDRDYDIPYFRADYNESVFLLCHVLTDNTVTTALLSNDHVSYANLTNIVVTLEYTKTTD